MAVLAIDVGGTKIRGALVSSRNCKLVRGSEVLANTPQTSKRDLFLEMAKVIGQIVKDAQTKGFRVKNIGIGMPTWFKCERGKYVSIYRKPDLPGEWLNYPAQERLEEALRRQGLGPEDFTFAFAPDDACAALGEASKAGIISKFNLRSKVLCITLGTGAGGRLIVNGKLRQDKPYTGHVFSLIPLLQGTPAETRQGREFSPLTVRDLISGTALGAFARNLALNRYIAKQPIPFVGLVGQPGTTHELIDRIDGEIVARALAGEGAAFEARAAEWLMETIGKNVGLLVASLLRGQVGGMLAIPKRARESYPRLFSDMDNLVVGGGMSEGITGEIILESAKRSLRNLGFHNFGIYLSELKGEAPIIGAAQLV